MTSTSFTHKKRLTRKIYGIAIAFLTLVIPYFIMLQSNGHIEEQQSFCPLKMITGFPCPGCGITKSLVSLYEGDIFESFYHHLFGPLTFLFCIVVILVLSLELITRKEYFRNVLYSRKLGYAMGATLAIYHVTRLIIFISTNSIDEILRETIWK